MFMTDLYLTHYYFGVREGAFHTGLGSILRAKGHSKPVLVIIIDDSFTWIPDLELEDSISYVTIGSNEAVNNVRNTLLDTLSVLKNAVCLIANFDLLITNGILSLHDLLQIIRDINNSNEYIFTSEDYFKELEEYADYVSSIKEL